MDRPEFRSIQEPAAANAVNRQKVSKLRGAPAQTDAAACHPKGPVRCVDATEGRPGPEPGARRYLRHEAGFVAEFSAGGSSGGFHTLDRANRNLGGEKLALLIGDWLSVNDEGGL